MAPEPAPQDPAGELAEGLGGMDIYLLDQLLRGRVLPGARVLDAGAGGGRNLRWFLDAGYDVHALDREPEAVRTLRSSFARRQPALEEGELERRIRCEELESTRLPPASFDLVIVNAVLHFARDHAHFETMFTAAFGLLAPGGVFFARLATAIGLPTAPRALGEGRYRLLDGSDRYLADEARLGRAESRVGARRLDPLKTTNVANLRCMTTWVLTRPAGSPPARPDQIG